MLDGSNAMTRLSSDSGESVMPYPDIVEYNEAIQHPNTAFIDPELKRGKVRETNLGLPLALSGGFALTYMVETQGRKLAVRCFHRQVPAAESKYAAIASKVNSVRNHYFVDFAYLPNGIKVKNGIYPIVRMDWVEGDTLGIYLDKNAERPEKIRKLRSEFQILAAYLERERIQHGDIQNGNVMISNGSVRLIDYDGMYVPGMQTGAGDELGHKHFQHPNRSSSDFGPKMDRFSFIAVDLSLMALIEDGALHKRFREGGETILFKANDFADPHNSEVFRLFLSKPSLKQPILSFTSICEASIDAVPTLADFLSGRNIPRPRTPKVATGLQQIPLVQKTVGYISPFDVVDAKDFQDALSKVGNRVELIGQIVAVKEGIGRRGRGRGKPFVFINFGDWKGDIAKVTIWSEGLSQLVESPSERWVGKWISVVGLIDPPYHGKHYGFHYTHVGITITDSNQINFLDEKEARFRLASIGGLQPKPDNKGILSRILGTKPPSAPATPVGPTPKSGVSGKSANTRVLEEIKRRQSGAVPSLTPTGTGHVTRSKPAPVQPQHSSGITPWLWIIVGLIILYLFVLRH